MITKKEEINKYLSKIAILLYKAPEDIVQYILGREPEGVLFDIVRDFKPKIEEPIEPQPETIEEKISNFYKECYLEKFHLPVGEMPPLPTVKKFFGKLTNGVGSEKTAYDLMRKGITWYLFMHKAEDAEGKKIPYLFRIFLEQPWLWRKCMESGHGLTIAMIKQAASSGDPIAAAKALKRGDLVSGFSDEISLTAEQDRVMKLGLKVQKEKGLGREFRSKPELRELYSSGVPTLEYIRRAEKIIEDTANE